MDQPGSKGENSEVHTSYFSWTVMLFSGKTCRWYKGIKNFLDAYNDITKVAEGNDQKRKRMKVDSDVIRHSPSMRNQIEAYASLKGEQVIEFYIYFLYIFQYHVHICFYLDQFHAHNVWFMQVAARVTAESADKDEWFVVKVIHFDRETKE